MIKKLVAVSSRLPWLSGDADLIPLTQTDVIRDFPRTVGHSFHYIRDLGVVRPDGVALLPFHCFEEQCVFLGTYMDHFCEGTPWNYELGKGIYMDQKQQARSAFLNSGHRLYQTNLCLEGGNVQYFLTANGEQGAVVGMSTLLMSYAYLKSTKHLNRKSTFSPFSAKLPETLTLDFLKNLALRFKVYELFEKLKQKNKEYQFCLDWGTNPIKERNTLLNVIGKMMALQTAFRGSESPSPTLLGYYNQLNALKLTYPNYTQWATATLQNAPLRLASGLENTCQALALALGVSVGNLGILLPIEYHLDMFMAISPEGKALLNDPQRVEQALKKSPHYSAYPTVEEGRPHHESEILEIQEAVRVNEAVLQDLGLEVFRVAGTFKLNPTMPRTFPEDTVMNLMNGVFIDYRGSKLFVTAGPAQGFQELMPFAESFKTQLESLGYSLFLLPPELSTALLAQNAGFHCVTQSRDFSPSDF
ncbi:MAG: hypothetical protein AB7F28_03895 [Candidatus Margulisiibacteriota bacterium]